MKFYSKRRAALRGGIVTREPSQMSLLPDPITGNSKPLPELIEGNFNFSKPTTPRSDRLLYALGGNGALIRRLSLGLINTQKTATRLISAVNKFVETVSGHKSLARTVALALIAGTVVTPASAWAAECAGVTNGLVACYPFDGDANDTSGNGINGTVNGATLTTDRLGNTNQAYYFDGDDYINAGNSPLFNLNHHTIAAWIKPESKGGLMYGPNSGKQIVGKVKPNSFWSVGAYLYQRPYDETLSLNLGPDKYLLTGFVTASDRTWLKGTSTIENQQWYFVTVTYDGAYVKFYVNGILNGSFPRTGTLGINTNDLAIGRHGGDINQFEDDNFFKGFIDDVRIYNRALSENEIQQLYQPVGQSNLVSSDCPNAICYVAKDGSDAIGNGSKEYPFSTIQHGINVVKDGGTVLVYPGTYVENLGFNSKNITVKSIEGAANTVIDGSKKYGVVFFRSSLPFVATFSGFTITNGGSLQNVGAVGISVYGGTPRLENLIVSGNVGMGIYYQSGSTAQVALSNLVVSKNQGGGIYFASHGTLSNSTVVGNTGGFGVRIQSGSAVKLRNSIVRDNSSYDIGFLSYNSRSIYQIEYSDIRQSGVEPNGNGTINWLAGNIDADPLFVDAANGNFHLSQSSPAINAGTLGENFPNADIEGTLRSKPDIGAYEYPENITLTITKTGDGTVTGQGIDCGTDCTETVATNTSINLTAIPTAGYQFHGWTGDCTGTNPTVTLTLTKNLACQAQFEILSPSLTVNQANNRRGRLQAHLRGETVPSLICNETCQTATHRYPQNGVVILSATAAKGYVFKEWNCTGSSYTLDSAKPNILKITITTETVCTASFEAILGELVTLTVNLIGTGSGTVISNKLGWECTASSCTGTYAKGQKLWLNAQPYAFSNLIMWGGDCSGQTSKVSLTLNQATTCTVNFQSELEVLAQTMTQMVYQEATSPNGEVSNLYPLATNAERLTEAFWLAAPILLLIDANLTVTQKWSEQLNGITGYNTPQAGQYTKVLTVKANLTVEILVKLQNASGLEEEVMLIIYYGEQAPTVANQPVILMPRLKM